MASTSKAARLALLAASSSQGADQVNIPLIRTKDNKKLSTYYAALQRPKEGSFGIEDLDSLQLELETLLSNAALRYRVLKQEYESLDKDERTKDRKDRAKQAASAADDLPSTSAAAAAASAAASAATETKSTGATAKRKRDEASGSRKPKHTLGSSLKQHGKNTKNSPQALNTDDSLECPPPVGSQSHHHPQKPSLPKNDTPNKFWLSVEPYCMPLTNEDLRLLDDLLEQYNGPLVPPIPELGPHYSSVWATEDLKEQQQASHPNPHSNRLKPQNSGASNILKKAEPLLDECITGPLTQRLVSALMEEQLIQNTGDLLGPDSSNSSSENAHSTAQLNFRSLSLLRNCIGIEKRVKKELMEHGILDICDFPNNDEDEILAEIKRVVEELSAVAKYNSVALKRLHESAAEEIRRLEIKRKLDVVDQEILETYKRCMLAKSKRKPLTSEEQKEIYRLTSEQKTLSDQLERIQKECPTYE